MDSQVAPTSSGQPPAHNHAVSPSSRGSSSVTIGSATTSSASSNANTARARPSGSGATLGQSSSPNTVISLVPAGTTRTPAASHAAPDGDATRSSASDPVSGSVDAGLFQAITA